MTASSGCAQELTQNSLEIKAEVVSKECANKCTSASLVLGAIVLSLMALFMPSSALAASFSGNELGLIWGTPFVVMLLSIALFPIFAEKFWHKYTFPWALLCIALFAIPFALVFGFEPLVHILVHAIAIEYLPFILLLTALYTIAGGLLVKGRLCGTPLSNTVLMGFATLLSSVVGTTGSSMILIRSFIRGNLERVKKTHVFVFFIFLVSNIGGSLTPLGDPPLFVGFLNGVDFFWPTIHMAAPFALLSVICLTLFYLVDRYFYAAEEEHVKAGFSQEVFSLSLGGFSNILLFAILMLAIILSASIDLGSFQLLGVEFQITGLLRDLVMIILIALSLATTPANIRQENFFDWEPIKEVAAVFFGIFITVAPVLEMLHSGSEGALAGMLALITDEQGNSIDVAYFGLTGILSAFLDNAPTYLVFFNAAGGDPDYLMNAGARTLLAISAGAVFMGSMSYIGNAPNLMVRSIAVRNSIAMPSFFGYMLWSIVLVGLPLVLIGWLFFTP